jgi:hypothetical protein
LNENEIKKINSIMSELILDSKNINNDELSQLLLNFNNISSNLTLDELSTLATKSRQILQYSGKISQMKSFSTPKKFDETLEMFQNILDNKKWEDPYMEVSLLLEWAMFRAFSAIGASVPDDYGPVLNSDGSAPIFTAGGNRPDLVAEFDDYVLVVESTVSSGSRQYNTETTPVARHIADIQTKYPKKKVYSFFVAREINPNVVEYFLIYYAFHKHPLSDQNMTVIPMDIILLRNLFMKFKKNMSNSSKIIKNIFEEIENQRSSFQCDSCNISKLDVKTFNSMIQKIFEKHLK